MRNCGISSRTVLLELDDLRYPPLNVPMNTFTDWLTIDIEDKEHPRYKDMAQILYERFCYLDTPHGQPSFPLICDKLNLTIDQLRGRYRRAMELLAKNPRYTVIQESGIVCENSLFFIELRFIHDTDLQNYEDDFLDNW